jgi:hypothetical protein
MEPVSAAGIMTAFAIGPKDYMANLKNPRNIIRYINSNAELSMTYMTSSSVAGYTFYNIPVHTIMNCSNCN